MSYAKILLDIRDGIATITLHRPEAYNALDMQLATELHDAVVTCSEDAAVRVSLARTFAVKADPAGAQFDGPVTVEQLDTTIVVYPGFACRVDDAGHLLLTLPHTLRRYGH